MQTRCWSFFKVKEMIQYLIILWRLLLQPNIGREPHHFLSFWSAIDSGVLLSNKYVVAVVLNHFLEQLLTFGKALDTAFASPK